LGVGVKVLAGDVGGTKTILAIAEVAEGRVHLLHEKRYASGDHPDFNSLVLSFLSGAKDEASHACFGVAGPVLQGRARFTNLPWVLVQSELQRDLGVAMIPVLSQGERASQEATSLLSALSLGLKP